MDFSRDICMYVHNIRMGIGTITVGIIGNVLQDVSSKDLLKYLIDLKKRTP